MAGFSSSVALFVAGLSPHVLVVAGVSSFAALLVMVLVGHRRVAGLLLGFGLVAAASSLVGLPENINFPVLYVVSTCLYVALFTLWLVAEDRRVPYLWFAVAGVAWLIDSVSASLTYGSEGFYWNVFLLASALAFLGFQGAGGWVDAAELARVVGVASIITVLAYNASGLSGGIYGGRPEYALIMAYIGVVVYLVFRRGGGGSLKPTALVPLTLTVFGLISLLAGWFLVFLAFSEFVNAAAGFVGSMVIFLAIAALPLYSIYARLGVSGLGVLLIMVALYSGVSSLLGWARLEALAASLVVSYLLLAVLSGRFLHLSTVVLAICVLALFQYSAHVGVVKGRALIPVYPGSSSNAPLSEGLEAAVSSFSVEVENYTYIASFDLEVSSAKGYRAGWSGRIEWASWSPPYEELVTYKFALPFHIVRISVRVDPELVSSAEAYGFCKTLEGAGGNCTRLWTGSLIVGARVYENYVLASLVSALPLLLVSPMLALTGFEQARRLRKFPGRSGLRVVDHG